MNYKKTYQKHPDNQLMQLIGKGDSLAFSELYARYSSQLFGYFLRMFFYDRTKAEDFTQDLFIKIIENPKRYNPELKFSTWLYTLASNLCKNEFRRMSRKPIVYQIPELKIEQKKLQLDSHDQDLNQYLNAALHGLEEKHRTCFVLRYQEGLSVEEVSQVLDCPKGTVKSRLFYALKKLAQHPELSRQFQNLLS